MYLSGKRGDLLLLLCIESAFVRPVGDNGLSELAAGQLMEHKTFFTCVDHGAIVQFLEFSGQLSLLRKGLQSLQNTVVHLFGSV